MPVWLTIVFEIVCELPAAPAGTGAMQVGETPQVSVPAEQPTAAGGGAAVGPPLAAYGADELPLVQVNVAVPSGAAPPQRRCVSLLGVQRVRDDAEAGAVEQLLKVRAIHQPQPASRDDDLRRELVDDRRQRLRRRRVP